MAEPGPYWWEALLFVAYILLLVIVTAIFNPSKLGVLLRNMKQDMSGPTPVLNR